MPVQKEKANSVFLTNIRISQMNSMAFCISCLWTRTDTLEKTSRFGLKRSQSRWTLRKRRDTRKNTGENLRPSANGRRPKQPRGDAWKSRGSRPWRGGYGKKTEGKSSSRNKERKRRESRGTYS